MKKHIAQGNSSIIREEAANRAGYFFRYSLFEEKHFMTDTRAVRYSVRIDLKTPDGKESFAITENYCYDAGRALAFYDLLVRNLATPKNLPYISEDFEF